ncbi:MAG: hypothetical protein NC408_01945 [Candidatus Gastranaerophilales bacterium]|nr:hypothetical protein [Candidatus Gastranaerophilales bacterium]MCM1073173.1 hypothetical protein [Bacteroides sp.]
MDNKCSKYEGLFVFSDEETLKKHIEECDECKQEHEKMEKVSDLLGEVKFYYKAKQRKLKKLRAVCAALFLVVFSTTFCVTAMDSDLSDILAYGDTLSAEDLGFPVDSYGLIMVDE